MKHYVVVSGWRVLSFEDCEIKAKRKVATLLSWGDAAFYEELDGPVPVGRVEQAAEEYECKLLAQRAQNNVVQLFPNRDPDDSGVHPLRAS